MKIIYITSLHEVEIHSLEGFSIWNGEECFESCFCFLWSKM